MVWIWTAPLVIACSSGSNEPATVSTTAPSTTAGAMAGTSPVAQVAPTAPTMQAPGPVTSPGTSGAGALAAAAVSGAPVGAGGVVASAAPSGGAGTAAAAGAPAATAGGMAMAGSSANGSAAGSGGAAGDAAAAGSGGSDSTSAEVDWTKRVDLEKGNGTDVVTIGDSWMAGPLNGAGIQAGLDRLGTSYRHYAVTATTLLSGQIPGQYNSAKSANPKISTVIMTGGGNDVMFSGGCSTAAACEDFAAMLTSALNELWTKMADDGVKDVIYVRYADSAGTTPKENRTTKPQVAPICMSGRIYCHTVPTSDIISSADLADGIHPGTAGNDRIAKRIMMMMEMRGIRR